MYLDVYNQTRYIEIYWNIIILITMDMLIIVNINSYIST